MKVRCMVSALAVMGLIAAGLAGCSQSGGGSTETTAAGSAASTTAAAGEESGGGGTDYPTQAITLIIPYSAGGSTDIGARLLAAEAEKILGQPIVSTNQEGAGGWIGWSSALSAEADGYTMVHTNSPNLITGYLDPQQNRSQTIEDFAPIILYAMDSNAVAIRADVTRFTTFEELVAYAKENEVFATSSGPAGDDDIAIKKLNQALGTKLTAVPTQSSSEALTSVLGGHIDVYVGNIGDTKVPTENGDLKPLAILAEERSAIMPDLPTVEELTGSLVTASSSRGIAVKAGTDPAIVEKLEEAFAEAAQTDSFKQSMLDQGIEAIAIVGDDYMELLKQEEAELKELAPLLGW